MSAKRSLKSTAPRREVYPRPAPDVNPPSGGVNPPPLPSGPRLWRALSILFGCLIASTTGCSPTTRPVLRTTYLVAARYDVEPLIVDLGRHGAMDTVQHDFQRLAQLGFDGVVLRHLDEADRSAILNTANETGLRVAIPDRRLDFYTTAGTLPVGFRSESDLVRTVANDLAGRPGVAAIVIHRPPDPKATRRETSLRRRLGTRGVASVSTGGSDADPTPASLITLDVATIESAGQSSVLESWLARYHEGLLDGRTAGLVMDRSRRPPGDPRGLIDPTRALGPANLTAVKQITRRAKRWGACLNRAVATPIRDAAWTVKDLATVALTRGQRRFVLIFNRSAKRFARGEVTLPESVAGRAVTRAVEVPPTTTSPAGHVSEPAQGRITLPVALRPGDAALFEIF